MSQQIFFQVQIKGGAAYPVSASELIVGTGAGCGLALRDPVASEQHCRFSAGAEGFQVEDLGSATGTWVNGIPADSPTRVMPGDDVVVGVTRLRIGSTGDTLELAVQEAEFHYTKSGAGGAQREADDWVRSEVGFGKIPAIRTAGWVATALALLFLLALLIGVVPSRSLMPGALAQGHAQLFELNIEEGRAQFGDAWAAMAERAQSEGCAVCHSSFEGPILSNCAGCHADKISSQVHPFHTEAGQFPSGSLDADSCMLCHSEHRGAQKQMRNATPEETCASCHATSDVAELMALREQYGGAEDPGESIAPQLQRAPIAYRDFNHSKHLAVAGIECAMCHSSENVDANDGEFSNVGFETCMGCHSDNPEQAQPEWAAIAANVGENLRFDLRWHGTDPHPDSGAETGCEQCHANDAPNGVHSGEFRAVTSPRLELAFGLRRNDHAHFFTDTSGRECIDCHRTGEPSVDTAVVEATFFHGVHLSDLDPTGDDADALSQSCAQCHSEQMSSQSLLADRGAQNYHGLLLDNCAACHADSGGTLLIESVGARDGADTIERVDFNHSLHATKVDGGCFRCHSFTDADNLFSARPTTAATIRNCTECHSGHENVGGGGCLVCHASVDGRAASVFRGEQEFRENSPMRSGPFSHWTEGHASKSCNDCHEDVYDALDVPAIQPPYQGRGVCNECHGGSSFHFSR